MVQEILAVKVSSLHHSISTVTGEQVGIFAFRAAPQFREVKKKSFS